MSIYDYAVLTLTAICAAQAGVYLYDRWRQ